jgi:hypothetical protein
LVDHKRPLDQSWPLCWLHGRKNNFGQKINKELQSFCN